MKNILVLYNGQSMYTPTVQDYVEAFSRYSKHNVHYLQVGRDTYPAFDLREYDLLLITYSCRLCYAESTFSPAMREAIRRFDGLKAAFVQDEYQETAELRRTLRDFGVNLVFTCVPEDRIPWVYPTDMFPGVRFVRVLTGYVPERLRHVGRHLLPSMESRPNWVGYRGRHLSYFWGDLGHYKVEIGRRFKSACERRGVPHDIAWTDDKRIYQDRWYEFITSCRTTLGTPSGLNVFDWDGGLEREFAELIRRRPDLTYEEYRPRIADREAEIDMGQVSPRMFEAAALGTTLVLLEADYGGILEPDVHYIPVKRDFSNVEDVLDQIADTRHLTRIADAAHDHLIASETWSYERFIEFVDAQLDALGGAAVSAVVRSEFLPAKAFDQSLLEEHTVASAAQYPLSRWLDLSHLRVREPGYVRLRSGVLATAPPRAVYRAAAVDAGDALKRELRLLPARGRQLMFGRILPALLRALPDWSRPPLRRFHAWLTGAPGASASTHGGPDALPYRPPATETVAALRHGAD